MVPLTPQAFAQRWGESTLPERSSYQQPFLDLCEMLGAPKPADIDPTGDFFTFEKGVEKTGGGKGFADVWYSDHFAIEYKGKLARCIEETVPHPEARDLEALAPRTAWLLHCPGYGGRDTPAERQRSGIQEASRRLVLLYVL
jgi:hypothetical protein